MVERADAIALVERWLRADAEHRGRPLDVRVDENGVTKVPEGWAVPWNTAEFLDGGGVSKAIFPPPTFIVTDPLTRDEEGGRLRQANTTPHPGFSTPVAWPGEPALQEIIDPEYRQLGFYSIGVPESAVGGWIVTHADGRKTERVNPKFGPQPVRLGAPHTRTPLEGLLNYLVVGRLRREKFLVALLDTEVLVPLGENDRPRIGSQTVVFSATRQSLEEMAWLRISVPDFIRRYPGRGMTINPNSHVAATVTGEELAEALAADPGRKPGEPRIVREAGPDGSLDEYAEQLQERFGVPVDGRSGLLRQWIAAARTSGRDLTFGERKKIMLATAWSRSNPAPTNPLLLEPSTGYGGRPWSGDVRPGVRWPENLGAHGLIAVHDDEGRVHPKISLHGTQPMAGYLDLHRSWHAVTGAYAGFAIGDALASAVHGMSPQEIRQRFGEKGIQRPAEVFDRPGQVSWRTQLLLFLTEGAVRGFETYGREKPSKLPLVIRSAHARWLAAQGVPWEQAAGPLAADHPEPDGFLSKSGQVHFRRGVPDELLAEVQRLIPDPSAPNGLTGPILLLWGLVSGVADARIDQGWNFASADQATIVAAMKVFQTLFQRESHKRDRFVPPVWTQLPEIIDWLSEQLPEGAEQLIPKLEYVSRNWRAFLSRDEDEDLASLGDGRDAQSAFARALLITARYGSYPRTALLSAVNSAGPSAMTTAITGAMVGARLGVTALPQDWLDALDIGDLIHEVAEDAYWNSAQRNPYYCESHEKSWALRYPEW